MFIVTWLFDKLGYIPKIDMEVGKVNLTVKSLYPVMEVNSLAEKTTPIAKKKPVVKKPAVAAKTARAKKVK